MKNISKIVKSIEDSGLLLEKVSLKIKIEGKEQKGGFLSMFIRYISCKSIRKFVGRQRSYKSRRRNK